MFKKISLQAGVIIMGSKTYAAIGRPLPGRKNIVMTRSPDGKPAAKNLVFTNHPPEKILTALEESGFRSAVLIGGAQINSLFAARGLIDEMLLTYCPKVFGTGLSLFSSEISMELRLKDVTRIGENSVTVRYEVIKPLVQRPRTAS